MNNTKKELQHSKIALIGMMGSGKTTVARALDKNAIDLDLEFEKIHNIKIKDYFEKFKESSFRDEETKLLKDISLKNNFVLSCGGGIILREENRDILFNKDIYTIYLETSVESIYERIKDDLTRPLLLVENPKKRIEEILNNRKKYYQMAHKTISTDNKKIEEIVKEIYENN